MPVPWDKVTIRINSAGRSRRAFGVTTDPDWSGLFSDHDLWYVWAGRGHVRTRQGTVELRPGQCLWCKPGFTYTTTWDPQDPIANYFVHFDLVDARGGLIGADPSLPPDVLHPEDIQAYEVMLRRIAALLLHSQWDHLVARNPPRGVRLAAACGILRGLLLDLVRPEQDYHIGGRLGTASRQYQAVQTVAAKIAEEPDGFVRVNELATEAGYCPKRFREVFRRILGCSPKQFAITARMQRARRLLREPGLAIKEVAARLGYDNVFYFSAQFKKVTGQTPCEFRAAHP